MKPIFPKVEVKEEPNYLTHESDPYNELNTVCVKKEEPEDDDFLYCETCRCSFFGRCEIHGTAVFIPDSFVPMGFPDRARRTFPPALVLQQSTIHTARLGVFNKGDIIPVGAHFGPFQGELVDKDKAFNSRFSWVISRKGHSEIYIDAKRETHANWMRYVNCAGPDETHNLLVFQYRGEIYFRCCRLIEPGQELLLWYAEDYAKDLSVTFQQLWDQKSSVNANGNAMTHKRTGTRLQVSELLSTVVDCESDGGEEQTIDAVDDSDAEMSLEVSTDEEANDTSDDDEEYSPPRKKSLAAENITSASSLKAMDGTVWERIDAESLHQNEFGTDVSFHEKAGPSEYAKCRITSRLQSFQCLFNMEMFMIITDCTVHEARQTNKDWSLSVSELMAFIAVLFLRATLCPIGAMIESWSEKYAIPAIKETMSRDRYKEIMRFLCFDTKDTRDERMKTNRFAPVSDIWQRFVHNCQLCYVPGQHITVVEQLFPTKVRCPFLHYSRPEKFGIKFWIAADLETKYMCNALPYLGKEHSNCKRETLSENVVMKLIEPFLGKGRNVTTDDFFTSMSLANRLLNHNTTLLGSISKIRLEIPPSAKNAKRRAEFSTMLYKSGNAMLTVYAPKKNKLDCVLSTIHQHVLLADGRKQEPNTITDYNSLKCDVDMDQMARVYSVRAGTHRWPIAVFYNMLDLAAMNAYLLYKACTGSTEGRRDFTHSLADELRQQFLLEKTIKKNLNLVLAPGKKTQCQVRTRCNRNNSTRQCEVCNKYTCRKCKKDDHWVCNKC